MQLAELCLANGHERIAQPILEQLTAEIDTHGLEGWETPALITQPFALLYRCLEQLGAADELKQRVYDRICRLDARRALSCIR